MGQQVGADRVHDGGIAEEDALRARFYAILAHVLGAPPSVETLGAFGALEGDETDMGQALSTLATIAGKTTVEAAGDEFDALGEDGKMTPDLVFRDPYVLDFLKLPRDFREEDLEAAILRQLEVFLLELGSGFSFVARQKRMPIGADDYYLDLLFFHRPLRALVAIELKLGRFDARDKGQMELYLRWLDRHERQPGENPPLGLILCADKNEEQIELLELNEGTVRVASYLTELPPRALLERKLTESIEHARRSLAARKDAP